MTKTVNGDGAASTPEQGHLVALGAEQLDAAITAAQQQSEALSVDLMQVVEFITSLAKQHGGDRVPVSDAAELKMATDAVNRLFHGMQFIDRLSQQVNNVRKNMRMLAEFMVKDPQSMRAAQWDVLLERTRGTYSMQAERAMFDAVFGDRFAGVPPENTVVFDITVGDA